MKIAFASCFDAHDDPIQPVWDRVLSFRPDILMLLGDTVYMDYGLLGSRHLGWPRKASNQEFANTLHGLYRLQWQVSSFRRLVSSGIKVGMTWDDHDFAWNNTRGAGTEKRFAVSRDKRLISKALFLQFRKVVRNGSDSPEYPEIPTMAEMLGSTDEGIQESFDHGNVRIIMLDGRSFREDPNDAPNAEMHGREQRRWLGEQLHSWTGPKVIGAGSVLSHCGESWDQYLDYAWLLDRPEDKIVVLTGDIHRNIPPVMHRESPPLYEITSSGAARPGIGGNKGNFGILNLDGEPFATLHSKEHPEGIRFSMRF